MFPLKGDEMLIHEFVFSTCHGQPEAVLIVTVPDSGLCVCTTATGLSASSQFVPHCETVKTRSSITMLPERRPVTRFSPMT